MAVIFDLESYGWEAMAASYGQESHGCTAGNCYNFRAGKPLLDIAGKSWLHISSWEAAAAKLSSWEAMAGKPRDTGNFRDNFWSANPSPNSLKHKLGIFPSELISRMKEDANPNLCREVECLLN